MGAEPSPAPLRVAVVEDEPLMRDLLAIALAHRPGLAVTGVFGDAATALAAIPAPRLRWHCSNGPRPA